MYATDVLVVCLLVSCAFAAPHMPVVSSSGKDDPSGYYYHQAAVENYPTMTTAKHPPSLPPSDEADQLYDALTEQGLNGDLNLETISENLKQKRVGIPIARSQVNTDSAEVIDVSDSEPIQKPEMPQDAFVISEPQESFVPPPDAGEAPKFSGSFKASKRSEDEKVVSDFDTSFGSISNPAAYYLKGGDFDKIAKPNCRMVGCEGPLPNDGNISFEADFNKDDQQCHQTFVPMNGCVGDKGYPMGMLCQICCDCTAEFSAEMKKTRGFKQGFQ
uniref:Kunitz/Bovine pancreatic trypsin inhibitor domain protein n=1 Tax=Steinernema glaseri TaxID=37863 RepID=A0A1I7ZBI0_9BILA